MDVCEGSGHIAGGRLRLGVLDAVDAHGRGWYLSPARRKPRAESISRWRSLQEYARRREGIEARGPRRNDLARRALEIHLENRFFSPPRPTALVWSSVYPEPKRKPATGPDDRGGRPLLPLHVQHD